MSTQPGQPAPPAAQPAPDAPQPARRWVALLRDGLVHWWRWWTDPKRRYERMGRLCFMAAVGSLAVPGLRVWLESRQWVELLVELSGTPAIVSVAFIAAGVFLFILDFHSRARGDSPAPGSEASSTVQTTGLALGGSQGATSGPQSPGVVRGDVHYGVPADEFARIIAEQAKKHGLELASTTQQRDETQRRLQATEEELAAAREALQRFQAEADRGDADARAVIREARQGDLGAAQERLIREARAAVSGFADRIGLLAHEIAAIAIVRGDTPTAREWLERLTAIRPQDHTAQIRLGDVLRAQGGLDAALARYRAAEATVSATLLKQPTSVHWQRELSVSHNKIGNVLVAQGKLEEALVAYRAGMAIRERLARADASNTEWQRDLGISHARLGTVAMEQRDFALARRELEAALALFERLAGLDPTNAVWAEDVRWARGQLSALP